MSDKDKSRLEHLAKAISKSRLLVHGSIVGSEDDYELVSYVDEVVVTDSLGRDIVSVPRDLDDEDD
jgi:hypothetical protein